jgi:hypothetical protein
VIDAPGDELVHHHALGDIVEFIGEHPAPGFHRELLVAGVLAGAGDGGGDRSGGELAAVAFADACEVDRREIERFGDGRLALAVGAVTAGAEEAEGLAAEVGLQVAAVLRKRG